MKKAFTLIELLIALAVVVVLAVVVFTILKPAGFLGESNDAVRVNDMSTLNKAVSLYYSDALDNPATLFMGTSSVIYISIPDPSATTTLGDQCQGLSLGALPSGYTYHCSSSSTYLAVNGTGWIPINFTSESTGAPISKLPIDPINTTSSNLYYTYTTDDMGGYKLSAFFESQKYASQMANDGGIDPDLYEKGTNLALASGRGLVGYWPLNEGTGTVAYDYSGSNNTGTWYGNASGTSGHYSPGNGQQWAGYFSTTASPFTENYISMGSSSFPLGSSPRSICEWIDPSTVVGGGYLFGYGTAAVAGGFEFYVSSVNVPQACIDTGVLASQQSCGAIAVPHQWQLVCATYDGSSVINIYLNGTIGPTTVGAVNTVYTNGYSTQSIANGTSGSGGPFPYSGLIQNVRLYNRALSAAEVLEMYHVGQ